MHFNLLEMAKGFSDGLAGRGGGDRWHEAMRKACCFFLGVTGFSDGCPAIAVPGSSVLHCLCHAWCIGQKQLLFQVAYLPIFPVILFHLNGGGACLKNSATLFFEVQNYCHCEQYNLYPWLITWQMALLSFSHQSWNLSRKV